MATVLDFVCAPAGVANVNSAASSPMAEVRTRLESLIPALILYPNASANDSVATNHRSLLYAVLPGVPFTAYSTSLTLSSTKITFMFL